VTIKGLVAIAVVDEHRIAITETRPAGENHLSGIGSVDRDAKGGAQIDPRVTLFEVSPGEGLVLAGPDEFPAPG
jgi:hypothetical protein